MKKVGIMTMYYQSINYGGLLQAYALCHYIEHLEGFQAEQICYSGKKNIKIKGILKRVKLLGPTQVLFKVLKRIKSKFNRFITVFFLKTQLELRKKAIVKFRELIPHSDIVYNDENLTDELYDIFVVGSDRVWNPNDAESPYYLKFVNKKNKIAYAASLTSNNLTSIHKKLLKEALINFNAISVREKESAKILSSFISKSIEWVCDPVMLLDKEIWDTVASPRFIKEDYIFCYFLSKDNMNREIVKLFSKLFSLKIVTIPHANNQICFNDLSFGDIKLYSVSPNDFLSYLKNAKYVFTDSFHATVFSIIFNKEVFALSREELKNSGTRIESLTSLLGIEDHYCVTDEMCNLSYLSNVPKINYVKINNMVSKFRKKSINYLEKALYAL